MTESDLRKLDQDQLDYFAQDGHVVYDDQWHEQTGRIPAEVADANADFRVLDIGGANGRFSDRLLSEYPRAQAVVLDNSEHLLSQNQPNDRKKIVLGSATDLPSLFESEKFDFIFINCLLHHLVTSSYQESRRVIAQVLSDMSGVLAANGRISIWENIFEGVFWHGLPGRMIFEITSIPAMARLVRKLGANTAGVGVCFLSRNQWEQELESAGMRLRATGWMPMRLPLYQRIPLGIGKIGAVHMWCSKI